LLFQFGPLKKHKGDNKPATYTQVSDMDIDGVEASQRTKDLDDDEDEVTEDQLFERTLSLLSSYQRCASRPIATVHPQ
jgi:hypothetical protein